ncbi:hypothetical protein [Janthinobacterium svalbardensis]|uniref:hypothetical protein n=1 Tax=Janthinobacterium svalbardensis TaxID=368607 RepID=UPI002FCD7DB1
MSLRTYIQRFIAVLPEAIALFENCSEDGFERNVTSFLLEAVTTLEQQKNYYKGATEEQMTGAILGFFNRYGIRASSQTNSNGHVDVFVYRLRSPEAVICIEAKIWGGVKRHRTSDMDQIMKYTSGRYPFSYLLVYVRKQDIAQRMKDLRQELDLYKPHKQIGICSSLENFKWALKSKHLHFSGDEVNLYHVGVNMCI